MAKVKSVKEDKEEPLEKQLWKSADKLRKNIDAAEYKHVVLGLIFLKYISNSFDELFAKLQSGEGEYEGADPEDRDEYKSEFALAEGKQGGQFYTPRSIVELLVAMLEPYKGRVIDPCCGSGGMFVQSEKFVAEHQGRINDILSGSQAPVWEPLSYKLLLGRSSGSWSFKNPIPKLELGNEQKLGRLGTANVTKN